RERSSCQNGTPNRRPCTSTMTRLTISLLLFLTFASEGAAAEEAEEIQENECLSSWVDEASGDTLCVRSETFNSDLCSGLEHFARRHDLPADFFARLIWKESLFRPGAVSHKGAEGIAQFMPGTARLRGL